MHYRIHLLPLIIGGVGCSEQGDVNGRALSYSHASDYEGLQYLKDLFNKIELIKRMSVRVCHFLKRDPVSEHMDPSETARRRDRDQHVL